MKYKISENIFFCFLNGQKFTFKMLKMFELYEYIALMRMKRR